MCKNKRNRPWHLLLFLALLVGLAPQAGGAALQPETLAEDLNTLVLQGNDLVAAMYKVRLTAESMNSQLSQLETEVVVYRTNVVNLYNTVAAEVGRTTFDLTNEVLIPLETLSAVTVTLAHGLLNLSDSVVQLAPTTDLDILEPSLVTIRRLDDEISVTADRIEEVGDKLLIMAGNIPAMAVRIRAARVIQTDNLRAFLEHVSLIRVHTIAATAGPGGSISPSGRVIVNYGEDLEFLMTPDPGCKVADVIVDGVSQGPLTAFTFIRVATDHSIEALFTGPCLGLALVAPNGGEVIRSGSTFEILWQAPPAAATFDLWYSLNNGNNWRRILTAVTGASYPWSVPTVSTTRSLCLVQIAGYDASGKAVGLDWSDGNFTITPSLPVDDNDVDSDGDGMGDAWEIAHFGDLDRADQTTDLDNDGALDQTEYENRSDPLDPDTDRDGFLDGADPLPLDYNYRDGDLDGSGQVDSADLYLCVRLAFGLLTPTTTHLQHGDVSPARGPDGVIDSSDTIMVLRKAAGMASF